MPYSMEKAISAISSEEVRNPPLDGSFVEYAKRTSMILAECEKVLNNIQDEAFGQFPREGQIQSDPEERFLLRTMAQNAQSADKILGMLVKIRNRMFGEG